MRFRFLVFLLLCVVVGACAGGGDDKRSLPAKPNTDTATTSTSAEQSAIQWDGCGQLECATLEVPRD